TDSAYDIGTSTNRVRDLYISSNSLHIGEDGDDGTISYNTSTNSFEINQKLVMTNALQSSMALVVPGMDTASAGALNIGTTTQTALNLGRLGANTTINGGNIMFNGNTSVATGGTFSVTS